MKSALFLRYRSKNFQEVIGQDLIVKTLILGLIKNKLPHSFIFSGIRGTGKTSLARILAKSFNCEKDFSKIFDHDMLENHSHIDGLCYEEKFEKTIAENSVPCGLCANCTMQHNMDIVEIDAASNTSVDDVRKIIESAQYRPVFSKYKVFIIDEVHMLSKSAFNALLKILEEPPEHVKFIFATTEIDKIPSTILSRCMKFNLNRIDKLVITNHLKYICDSEGYKADIAALSLIAQYSYGSVRDAISILDQAILLSQNQNVDLNTVQSMLTIANADLENELFGAILNGDLTKLVKIFGVIRNTNPLILLEDLIRICGDCVRFKAGVEIAVSENMKSVISSNDMSDFMRIWDMMIAGYDDVKRSFYPNDAVEIILIKCAYIRKNISPEKIIDILKGNSAAQSLGNVSNVLSHVHSDKDVISCIASSIKKDIISQRRNGNGQINFADYDDMSSDEENQNDFLEQRSTNSIAHDVDEKISNQVYLKSYDVDRGTSQAECNFAGVKDDLNEVDVNLRQIRSFKDVLTIVRQSRMPLLYSFLLNDFHLISFESRGKIRFFVQNNMLMVNELQDFLSKMTNIKWYFEFVNDASVASVRDTFGVLSSFGDISQSDVIAELKNLFDEEDISILDIDWGME